MLYLTVHRDELMDDKAAQLFRDLINRRGTGEPVAQLVRHKEFMSIDFYVDERVLVPRPDTEHLAEYALEFCQGRKAPRVLDLCTGSGALAVSIAHYAPHSRVFAADISDGALEICAKNAKKNSAEVTVFRMDVLTELATHDQTYDLIVSNPPYIEHDVIASLDKDVAMFEPHLALDGGEDGLDFYRVLAKECPLLLSDGGSLAFEVGIGQADSVAEMMRESFCDIEIRKDYAGIERVVYGIKKASD